MPTPRTADPLTPPPGATYTASPAGFRVTVPSATQSWLTTPLVLIWIAIAAYAFVIAPKRPDAPSSDTLVIAAFAALIGIPLFASVLFFRYGRLTITCDYATATIREHIGPLGTSRQFAWSALAAASEVDLKSGRHRYKAVELDLSAARSHRRLYTARSVPEEIRRFLIAVLEGEIAKHRRASPLGLDT